MEPNDNDGVLRIALRGPLTTTKSTAPEAGRRIIDRLRFLAQMTLAIGLLSAVAWTVDLREIIATLSSVELLLVLAGAVVICADRWLMAYKWNLLLRARGVRISTWQAICISLQGNLLGVFTPGGIGADAYRVAALTRFESNPAVFATVVLERFIGLAVIGSFAAVALPVWVRFIAPDSRNLVWIVGLGTAATLLALALSLRPTVVKTLAQRIPYVRRRSFWGKLGRLYDAYAENRHYPGTLATFTALTALEVVLVVCFTFLAIRSTGAEVSFAYCMSFIPLLAMVMRLPITFQGIGVFEGGLAFVLQIGGFPAAAGLSAALLLRGAEVVLILLPGALMLWLMPMSVAPSGKD